VLEALGIERAHFVGQSLGGWIAAWLAITRPGRVERLILIEPAGLLSEKERLADPRIAAAYAAGGEAFENPSREAVAKRLKGLLADPDAIDPEILEIRWRLYQPPQARAVHKNVRRADNDAFLLRPDVLGRLRAPTLFVRGSLGNTPLQIVEEAVRACPQARLETIEGVRQWPQFEAASRVNAVIREFLG
jgi:pimeloyl-ACP methyl ester carboxylesterase